MSSQHDVLIQLQMDLPDPDRISPENLEDIVAKTLGLAGVEDRVMISIVIGDDDYLQSLNNQFRGIDAPTDVLSFPSDPLPEGVQDPDETSRYLGDIAISLPYVVRRVATEDHSIWDELALLMIHGTLHLLGYDHDTEETQQAMWAIQAQALEAADIKLVVPDYIHDDAQ